MSDIEYLLFKGCKERDAKKQKETFIFYFKRFLAICERYTKDEEEAQDIVQESFISIFNKIDGFTWHGKNSFEKWMKRIVVNAAINNYNKKKKNTHISIDDYENSFIETAEESSCSVFEIENLKPEHLIQFNICEEELIASINNLPEHFKVVFNMHVIDGYSHKEISEVLKISEKTSTTRLFRARKLIQTNIVTMIKERGVVYEGK